MYRLLSGCTKKVINCFIHNHVVTKLPVRLLCAPFVFRCAHVCSLRLIYYADSLHKSLVHENIRFFKPFQRFYKCLMLYGAIANLSYHCWNTHTRVHTHTHTHANRHAHTHSHTRACAQCFFTCTVDRPLSNSTGRQRRKTTPALSFHVHTKFLFQELSPGYRTRVTINRR